MSAFLDTLAGRLYGETHAEASARGVCIRCKKPPVFLTDAGRREWGISGICEPCFDTLFAEPPYQRPGECQHISITDAALDDRDTLIVTTWGDAEPLKCPDCHEYLYPWHGACDVVYVGEPHGAGAD